MIDNQWFGYEGSFNIENDVSWTPSLMVKFNEKNWKDYVSDIRLEITCGEAPYLVSRYDTVTGEKIDLLTRIGLFDRKMRVINENTTSDQEWIDESLNALKSIYGYEYQGDNLLIARQNIFFSYIDYYLNKFSLMPNDELLKLVAEIISWNIWQMDGIKFVVPLSCHEETVIQLSLFDDEPAQLEICRGCKNNDITKHNGIRCNIMDWTKKKPVKFMSLMKGVFVW